MPSADFAQPSTKKSKEDKWWRPLLPRTISLSSSGRRVSRSFSSDYERPKSVVDPSLFGKAECPVAHQSTTLTNYATGKTTTCPISGASHSGITLDDTGCSKDVCVAALMDAGTIYGDDDVDSAKLLHEAVEFLETFYSETEGIKKEISLRERIAQVKREVGRTGTYRHTYEELAYGVKLGWRNSSRCIFRIQWKNITVIDERLCDTAEGMVEACQRHLNEATNGGTIKSTITIFPQRKNGKRGPRIWNPQLLRYAGYARSDLAKYGLHVDREEGLEAARELVRPEGDAFSDILGDPAHVEFTRVCLEMGWRPQGGVAGWFDMLPIVAEDASGHVAWSEFSPDSILEVPITHPDYPELESYKIKWHAVPAISSFALSIGGVTYSACPFNGWYMSAEIGSRNLGDVQRYNLLPLIGHLMGYDSHAQSNKRSLWKDRAFVELNAAVLSSFDKLGVSVVDHHTASDSFINFANREMSSRGYFTGDWVWLTPPISGSATSVFHQEMVKMALKPAFMGFREPSWKSGNAKGARREKSKGGATRAADPSLSRETDDDHLLASARSIVNISGNITTDSSTTAIDDKSTRGSTQSTLTSSHQSESSVVDSALLENASILVGTETGTAEQLANRFSVNLRKQGVNITPCLIESLQQPLLSHLKQKRIIFVFLSTFGDGELPTEAAKSIQQLATSANGSLSHLSFAVFGLCSSAYPRTFNGAANTLSSTLMVLGATRLGPIGAGDELEDREGAFQQWQQNVFDSIGLSNKRLTTIIDSKSAPNTLASPSNDWIDATITKSTTLFKDGVRGTWHIELAADDLRYNPGDHLAITPLNPAFIVDEAMTLFGTADPSHHKLLHSTVDLMGPCPTNLLFFMRDVAESSGSKSDAAKLDRLLSQSDTKTGTSALSTLDVFRLFKSVIGSKNSKRPALTDFLSYAPTLQPRYYSIASASTGGAALTVSRHHFSRPDGTAAFGLCSEYLIQMPVSSTLRFMVRQCPRFHLQTPLAKPTAMVANGTGIAPFRAFIEQIRDSRKTDGISEALDAPLILYFGCRSIKEFLYRHEIEQALRDGILSKCVVALSRETAPPPSGVKARTIIYRSNCRVQDVVKEDVDGMKGVLLGGAVFVCGARTMGVAVSEACDALAKAELGVKSWTKTAKKAGAFIEDTY